MDSLVNHEVRFQFLEHESIIVINTIHFCLLIHYLIFEVIGYLYSQCCYPKLPRLLYLTSALSDTIIGGLLSPSLKLLALIGSGFALVGATNLKLTLLLTGLIISAPFSIYDLYLFFMGKFHHIDPENFLLCQTLFTSTFRFFGILATLSNVVVLFYSY